jgi:hypothetical protein
LAVRIWSGVIWFRAGTGGGILWTRWWTFRFWRYRFSYLVSIHLQQNTIGSSCKN